MRDLYMVIVVVFAFALGMVIGVAIKQSDSYRQGQIDYANGKIKYHRVVDTVEKWEAK